MKTYRDYGIDASDSGTGEYRTVCPKCDPTRKSKGEKDLSVNLTKQTWCCHHCGFAGGLTNVSQSAIKSNCAAFPAKIQPLAQDGPVDAFAIQDLHPLTPDGSTYLAGRGISPATADAAGIKSKVMFFHKLGHPGEAIAFPVVKDGKIVNVKYRALEKKEFSQAKGGDQTALFNGDSMTGSDTIIFTEGELDVLSVMEAGYPCSVSCPNGAPPPDARNTSTKLAFTEANREAFNAADRVVLVMDKDEPGLAFEKLVAEHVGPEKCWTVEYPAGCKDANDVLVKHGAAVLKSAIDSSKPYPVNGITTFAEHTDEILQYYKDRGQGNLFSTGIPAVDKTFKLQIGTLNILTGIPSHGKSEILDQFIVNTARLHGWKWALFSPENYPIANHFQKLAEKWTGKPMFNPFTNASWNIPEMNENEVQTAITELSACVQILTITEAGADIDSILRRVAVCAARDKIKAFVIDPWNEIEHKRPVRLTETEYISDVLSKVRNFARLHDLCAWIVVHPAKMVKDGKGNYPVPTPYDISGSAHWRNKADSCLCVWRDIAKNDGSIELHIQKVRNKNAGRAGEVVKLKWTRANGIISDALLESEMQNIQPAAAAKAGSIAP